MSIYRLSATLGLTNAQKYEPAGRPPISLGTMCSGTFVMSSHETFNVGSMKLFSL